MGFEFYEFTDAERAQWMTVINDASYKWAVSEFGKKATDEVLDWVEATK